ncbi:hypothetical protein GOHSU_25_00350 [Gordonia hirsuta DSM 44140 = NBRC 16056]|uniref:Rhodanese domain-containing protein n=1 Tax=Gordonia hirsuta DSM 44140 = NBRC 16056 TaxID=1121927 RepID=L7L9H8_9ACTN|nr:rhodanese-like domain-containing protein [Gordonia hirsuta]GAC57800.1 hypothetical protein GOHSU_25_00350 [Gordonia hirsuta DSM 44140 = NBRC 16056]
MTGVDPAATILDVRTAAEYAMGHVDGAQLLDFSQGSVATVLADLDPAASYVLYCRSGNRSGQAVAVMRRAGFADLTNLGSVEEASQATGRPIVS